MVPLPPIFEHPTVKRARAFLASLLPAERAHFLFLIGALLIFCAGAHAFSSFFPSDKAFDRRYVAQPSLGYPIWLVFELIPYFSFFAAGLGAFAVCFGSTQSTLRRAFLLVVLPSGPGILALVAERYLGTAEKRSVFEGGAKGLERLGLALADLFTHPSVGLCMWLVGLVLLGIGVLRVTRGRNTLPVRFGPWPGEESASSSTEPSGGSLLKFFIAVLVLTQVARWALVPFGVFFPRGLPQESLFKWVPLINSLFTVLPSLMPVVCAMWLLRVAQRSVLPGSLRRFGAMDVVVAALLPAVVWFLPSLLIWGFQNLRWQINRMSDDPSSLTLATVNLNLWELAVFLPVFAEELGWRCALQPVLTRRFGVRRGLLLVGFIWGLWHLPGAAESFSYAPFAPLGPFARLLRMSLLGVCLGWLFLRTNSIWPVTLLHGAYNLFYSWSIFIFPYELWKQPRGLLSWLLLAVCAFLLFRCWPPVAEGTPSVARQSAVPSRWSRVKWPPQDNSSE